MQPLERLKFLSMANIPKFLYFGSTRTTRYEHSLSASRLARFVRAPADVREVLRIALLYHDVGSYAFSHLGERVAKKFGYPDHEARALELLPGNIPEEVFRIFEKRSELSKFVFGKIDLDNIDNLASYLMGFDSEPLYSPEKLASSFSYPPFSFNPPEDELEKWKNTRAIVYQHIIAPNILILEAMLEEAFTRAEKPELLLLTDREAFSGLKRTAGREIALKVQKGELWRIKRVHIAEKLEDSYDFETTVKVCKDRPLKVGVDFYR